MVGEVQTVEVDYSQAVIPPYTLKMNYCHFSIALCPNEPKRQCLKMCFLFLTYFVVMEFWDPPCLFTEIYYAKLIGFKAHMLYIISSNEMINPIQENYSLNNSSICLLCK